MFPTLYQRFIQNTKFLQFYACYPYIRTDFCHLCVIPTQILISLKLGLDDPLVQKISNSRVELLKLGLLIFSLRSSSSDFEIGIANFNTHRTNDYFSCEIAREISRLGECVSKDMLAVL